jgi:hypothetical protein
MNSNFDNEKINRYEGNGWSKYQIMVLQQLEDHSEVLHNLNKEMVEIKQAIAVSDTELKIWRQSIMKDVEALEEQMDCILYEDDGVKDKLNKMESEMFYKEKSLNRNKALWAGIGAAVVCILDLFTKFLSVFKN